MGAETNARGVIWQQAGSVRVRLGGTVWNGMRWDGTGWDGSGIYNDTSRSEISWIKATVLRVHYSFGAIHPLCSGPFQWPI